ncbi:hypothetical protein AVMA1855_18490 [Acidovorax sp. SUPP1855]|uniref:hypothetical protein n=1 Tax=Acidovorax sp. SUPP1855 TaxID=431774 RepID=UPI0023DE3F85|nr:hypothetical protein [Acidovorax sp. SUPP1855]GKS86172.1 hypothetical protein AVMA1855_18490 [Acidovorax sp. SUPP1855]
MQLFCNVVAARADSPGFSLRPDAGALSTGRQSNMQQFLQTPSLPLKKKNCDTVLRALVTADFFIRFQPYGAGQFKTKR